MTRPARLPGEALEPDAAGGAVVKDFLLLSWKLPENFIDSQHKVFAGQKPFMEAIELTRGTTSAKGSARDPGSQCKAGGACLHAGGNHLWESVKQVTI